MTSPVAARPQTHIQSRIEQETAIRMESHEKGSPDAMPEIEREITMAMGAVHGVEQRLGELVAKLRPVLDEKTWMTLTRGDDNTVRPSEDLAMAPQSEYGTRLRALQYEITALEHVLSYLVQGVRT